MKAILSAILYPLVWFCAYALPWLGLAGLVGIPLAHIWVDFSWWWMAAPVMAGVIWFAVVICIADAIGG
jgi:hypothetical protein